MSGILAVYALVISVLIANDIRPPGDGEGKQYSLFAGFLHMAAGLSVGLAGMAAGYAIGIVGDVVRRNRHAFSTDKLIMAGRSRIYEPVKNLCGHGPDPHFRRSFGALRVSSWTLLGLVMTH
jgi:hypothetical protein